MTSSSDSNRQVPRSNRTRRPRPSKRPRLNKSLGQHHLVDGALCRPLVDWLEPAGETVLEIGPGGGVLTRELLAARARVLAIERDPEWAFHLAARRLPNLALAVSDALDLDPRQLAPGTLVAGNLPFNVGTKILEGLLPHGERVPRIGVMVQKEVADRLVARPGDGAYGALSVLVAAYARVRTLAVVKPGSFRPPPKVAAAFVGLTLGPPPVPAASMPRLERVIKAAFGQRRKTLRNSLGAVFGRARALAMLDAAGIDSGRRAETLGLDDYVRLGEVEIVA